MPYRIDLDATSDDVIDGLIELGALDVERTGEGGTAALLPDHVAPEQVARALGVSDVRASSAVGRDAESVWILTPRAIQAGRLRIVPSVAGGEPGALRLQDASAFGTGLHPTTALCLEALDDIVQVSPPASVLDVGTGSGILALAALMLGVPTATGLDVDDDALRVAAGNARINGMIDRLQLVHGGPGATPGTWPLVLANVLAAPLIEMAPALVRRVAHHGQLVLSGIPHSVEQDVSDAYRRLGMHRTSVKSRAGWVALVFRASW